MSFFKKKNFLIAEAGINHNGDLKQALKLVSAAKKSGADAIKFQTYITEKRTRNRLHLLAQPDEFFAHGQRPLRHDPASSQPSQRKLRSA